MNLVKTATYILVTAAMALAQESGIHVRTIRVLAADPEAVATFYEKAFGMSEIRRPVTTATLQEIVVNSGSTVDLAKQATTTPIVITTRPKDAPAGAQIFNRLYRRFRQRPRRQSGRTANDRGIAPKTHSETLGR